MFDADEQKRFQEALDSNAHFRDWHDATLKRMEGESELVVAILGATLLDEQLTDAIKSRFSVNDKFSDGVFDHKAGLSFKGKVRLAYAIGLVPRGFANDLEHIGSIRNKFAHELVLSASGSGEPAIVSFSSPQIAEKCNSLLTPDVFSGLSENEPTQPKDKFIFTVSKIASVLGMQKIGLPKSGSYYDR